VNATHDETAARAEARLASVLEAFDAGEDARMASPASEEDLRRVEAKLGHPLPAALRALLLRVGGGLFAHGHEVFGPTRVMIHDIELVPDVLSVRARLTAEGRTDATEIPFHRGGQVIHLMRTEGAAAGEVISLPPGEVYPDLAAFVEAVMLRDSVGGAARSR
jgi:hypothetical protein